MKPLKHFCLAVFNIMVSYTLIYTIQLATKHDPDVKGTTVIFISVLTALTFANGIRHASITFIPPKLPATEGWDGD